MMARVGSFFQCEFGVVLGALEKRQELEAGHGLALSKVLCSRLASLTESSLL